MKISVVGTGYVGLVTGVSLSEIGHQVTCVDINEKKIEKMKRGISPIYEPGLSELMNKNILENGLEFTTSHKEAFKDAEVIYIAVGTPEEPSGAANLDYVEKAAIDIAKHITSHVTVVTKSTVPVGTNHKLLQVIKQNLVHPVRVDIVSNPEFLKEGSAIHDSFHGDRIIIGAETGHAFKVMETINKPFGIPIYKTDIKSAEMIKYASNGFLATKISFINEISNICELVGANIENVAAGMGMDQRIGSQFLKAGIGYGGSCFPKDTKALIQIAGDFEYDFKLLKGVVSVNKKQQRILVNKLKGCFSNLYGKKIGILGLAFKPNTDDMREAASIQVTNELLSLGASVIAYDPIAIDNAKRILDPLVDYAYSVEEAVVGCDAVLILTEWDEIKSMDLSVFKRMKQPLVIDGRNCFSLDSMKQARIEYHSIGRPSVIEIIETASL
ncbi:UDP-glucose/GDP-mannose dehydrogenase family protein [Planococcus sp. 107-1]|uniref:UDP-glucose dehydrogenase family protein n=1 Tax=Planococcus sp. 107-1 TaxID=2908840 RepID=UPI001F35CCD0|nr:UDP-glucose/GDP-mannose dehydrogenase family protein [Planococcus sp. 107-1]UJF26070.1 UDP-glucose/GDP-mannose dehydrogenase family protein [Planococcus sp. 107-1]